MSEFSGFPAECLPFLSRLQGNNDRTWFSQHKPEYELYVREPALSFIRAVAPGLEKISPHFRAVAKKNGGSLMRVYRDTRFSSDKTPYKSNIGIQFRHQLGKDVHAPGFYVHIAPDSCFIGVGIWHPDTKVLTKIRDFLSDNPAAWRKARNHRPFKRNFVLEGDALKRPPRGYPADHPLIEDLKRKDFIACSYFDPREINSGALVRSVLGGFRQGDPFMRYLCAAVDVMYSIGATLTGVCWCWHLIARLKSGAFRNCDPRKATQFI